MISIAERRVALLNGGLQRAYEEMNATESKLIHAMRASRALVELGMTWQDADNACSIPQLTREVETAKLVFEEMNRAVYLAVAGGIR